MFCKGKLYCLPIVFTLLILISCDTSNSNGTYAWVGKWDVISSDPVGEIGSDEFWLLDKEEFTIIFDRRDCMYCDYSCEAVSGTITESSEKSFTCFFPSLEERARLSVKESSSSIIKLIFTYFSYEGLEDKNQEFNDINLEVTLSKLDELPFTLDECKSN